MACIRIKQLSIGITCDFKRASMKTTYKAIDLNLYMNEETNKRIDVNAGKQTDRATTIWNRLRSSATYIFVSFYVWFGKFILFAHVDAHSEILVAFSLHDMLLKNGF